MFLLAFLILIPVLYVSKCRHDVTSLSPVPVYCIIPIPNSTSMAMSLTSFSTSLSIPQLNNTILRRIAPSLQSWTMQGHMPFKQPQRAYASNTGAFTYRLAAASIGKATPPRQPQVGRDFWNYASCQASASPPYLRSTREDSGEDAFFATTVGGSANHVAFGVADGVGGWQESGVDPAVFSNALCGLMAGTAYAHEGSAEGKTVRPRELLQIAYDAVIANPRILAGGCTASLAVANAEGEMETANLGDSGFLIIGPGKVTYRSKSQTHAFNTPYQLSKVPAKMQAQSAIFGGATHYSETPKQADVETHRLNHGDVVLFATDGVWDNLSAQDTLVIITKIMEDHGFWSKSDKSAGGETILNASSVQEIPEKIDDRITETFLPGLLARAVMRAAKVAGLDQRRNGPFAKEVKRHYPGEAWRGGKPDDIAVVACVAADRPDGQTNDEAYSEHAELKPYNQHTCLLRYALRLTATPLSEAACAHVTGASVLGQRLSQPSALLDMYLDNFSTLPLLPPPIRPYTDQSDAIIQLVVLPPEALVTFTRRVEDGATFDVPPGDIAYTTSPTGLRALCAVVVRVNTSSSSAYSFGVFLPDQWNSRFLAVGNGAFAGGINWLDMGAGVTSYGFAVMSTDTGHTSTAVDASWALHQPQKQIDWGYRAMHGATIIARQMVSAYYRSSVTYSYYSGCSTGGRQGLMEAERFPYDFDGLLVGAPAWWPSHLQTWTLKQGLYNYPDSSASHIPVGLFSDIATTIQKQCDPQDGLTDGIIADPDRCYIRLDEMACNPSVLGQTEAICLTAAQLGSENQWSVLLGGDEPSALGTDYVRNFVVNDTTWDFRTYNDSIVTLAAQLNPGSADANDFDLSPLQQIGGKIIHYHGLADGLIPAGYSEYFYQQVTSTLQTHGIDLDDWYRLFLVPGMQHCGTTPTSVNAPWYFAGANQAGQLGTGISGVPGFRDPEHDALLALMRWTEDGIAPDRIVATKFINESAVDQRGGDVLRQRPLCPFPRKAKYDGIGNADHAEAWACVLR
nr:putative feruloyl esterase b [Quercus suber]